MAKRTPEDACVEYAIAAAEVRQLTKVIGDPLNRCLRVLAWEAEGIESMCIVPQPEECLTVHWRIVLERGGDGEAREAPEMPYVDMCDSCQLRHSRVRERRTARQRLGVAKRSVEAVGKRLNAECGTKETSSPR